MKFKYNVALGLICLLIASFAVIKLDKSAVVTAADKIIFNGIVVTVNDANTIAEAVAIKDGNILAVGTNKEIKAFKGYLTEVIDLHGKTLIPGFIDGHSHFVSVSRTRGPSLAPPPVGKVKNIADIVAELKKYKEEHNIKPGEWITGSGYDPDQLDEQRQPTKEDLDAAFPDNPVVITHVSGHMRVANSYALKASNITAITLDPKGGIVVRKKGTNEPAGLLQETAGSLFTAVLPLQQIANTPKDRIGIAASQVIFGSAGTSIVAIIILIATFGCNNGLILSGARVYYTMAKDKLFFKKVGTLNKHSVPEIALWLQFIVAAILSLSGKYGNLLDMISFVVVIFYILTIAGIIVLRKTQPNIERPYKAFGYPFLPIIYIIMGIAFCGLLIVYKPQFAWPGLIITLIGIPLYYINKRSHG